MAIPSAGSAIEKLMLAQMVDASLLQYQGRFFEQFMKPISRIVGDKIQFRIRRAPYTDDAWQMLADMGIEPAPRRQPLPRDIEIVITNRSWSFE